MADDQVDSIVSDFAGIAKALRDLKEQEARDRPCQDCNGTGSSYQEGLVLPCNTCQPPEPPHPTDRLDGWFCYY